MEHTPEDVLCPSFSLDGTNMFSDAEMENNLDEIDLLSTSTETDFFTNPSLLSCSADSDLFLFFDAEYETGQTILPSLLHNTFRAFESHTIDSFNVDRDVGSGTLTTTTTTRDTYFGFPSETQPDSIAELDGNSWLRTPPDNMVTGGPQPLFDNSPSSTDNFTRSNCISTTELTRTSAPRPHYASERRYRVSLNTKMAELNKRIPSLDDFDSAKSMTPSGDFEREKSSNSNKAFTLERAIKYIRHLEKLDREKEQRLDSLKQRLNFSLTLLRGYQAAFTSERLNADLMWEDTSPLM